MTDETEKTPARVESVIKSMIEARVARERAEAELAEKKAQEKSLRDRMALLEAALQPRSITAWCADATEDAEGTVGTIEVNGEFGAQDSILVVAPQEVLPTLQGPSFEVYFIYPSDLKRSKRIAAFRQFLIDQSADWEP